MKRLVTFLTFVVALVVPRAVHAQPSGQPQPAAQPAQPAAQPRPAAPASAKPAGSAKPATSAAPGASAAPTAQPQPVRIQPGQGVPPRPGMQPGQQPRRIQPNPVQDPHAAAATKPEGHEAHEEGGEHECHGNWDPLPHINWYQGILGVDNEKSQQPGINKLLWRYNNAKDECDHKNQEPPVLAQVINFTVFVIVLLSFGRKPIVDGLLKRKKTIMADIDAAEAQRADAESRLHKYEKQLKNIAARRTELEEEYRLQSEADRKRVLAEAEEKRVRMIKDAEFRVQQELRQAQGELLAEAVESAIAAAEELIKKRVEQKDLERLADEYLTGLGAALAKSESKSKSGGAS